MLFPCSALLAEHSESCALDAMWHNESSLRCRLAPAACEATKQRVQAALGTNAGYGQQANATGDYLLPWDPDVKDYLAFGPKEVANLAFEPSTPMFGTGANYQLNRTCCWWFFSTL